MNPSGTVFICLFSILKNSQLEHEQVSREPRQKRAKRRCFVNASAGKRTGPVLRERTDRKQSKYWQKRCLLAILRRMPYGGTSI